MEEKNQKEKIEKIDSTDKIIETIRKEAEEIESESDEILKKYKEKERKKKYWNIKKIRERDKGLVDSFNYAIEGLTAAIRNEKHMKVHITASIFVLILAILTNASKVEILIISLAIAFIMITELINTSVEALVDLVSPKRHPLAKLAKDTAAGAVLIATINALCVGYLLFYDKMLDILDSKNQLHVIAGRKGNISILIIVLTAIIVIIMKSFYKKGTPLEGGMPSGHSAIAFSTFGIVLFMTGDIRVLVLVFFMALLVAQSRVKAGIHSIAEVFAGGVIGFSIAFSILFVMTKFGILYN